MKAILVAIYVAGLGAADRSKPVDIAWYEMPSMAECRETARVMVGRAKVGHMRAFCEKFPE